MSHSFEDENKDYEDRLTAQKIERALRESVKLQSHYAKLLNMHDGGLRKEFTMTEWLDRLDETMGKLR